METLPEDILKLAESLSATKCDGPGLKIKEALEDYNNVCTHLKDGGLSPGDRVQWLEIHSELRDEIVRLTTRLK